MAWAHRVKTRDEGLFGPGSVTWKVHASPTMLIGGMRALVIQALHPLAMAGVAQHSDYETRGVYRLRRTIQYVLTVTFGDTHSARASGALVRRVHERVQGLDPVTGRTYSAADPETLLWVHAVEVHSFLSAYRAYAGRLSPDEQDRYLAESVRSAELVGLDPKDVPKNRAEMRRYFESMDPKLCVSQSALSAIRFVTNPPVHRRTLALTASLRVVSRAAVALVPRHLRALAGLERPWLADALTFATVSAATRPLAMALELPFAERANLERLRQFAAEHPFASVPVPASRAVA